MTRVLGVDICKAGWVGVLRDDGDVSAFVASTIEQLVADVERSGPLVVIAIDIPIGLPDIACGQPTASPGP